MTYQNQTVGYDTLDRQAYVSGQDNVVLTTEYDAVGNKVHQHASYAATLGGIQLGLTKDMWYAYDSMNRQTLVDGAVDGNVANLGNLTAGQGHILGYDLNGNRISDTHWGAQIVLQYETLDEAGTALAAPVFASAVVTQGIATQWYTYDSMNRLSGVADQRFVQLQTGWDESGATTGKGGNGGTGGTGGTTATTESGTPIYAPASGQDRSQAILVESRLYDGASRMVASNSMVASSLGVSTTAPTADSQALYAAYLLGLTQSGTSAPGLVSTTIDYDAAGRVISNIEINQLNIGKNVLNYYQQFAPTSTPSPFDAPVSGASGYDAAGNLLASRTVTASGGAFIIESTVVSLTKMEGYKESGQTSVSINASAGTFTNGVTQESYDANGFLRGVGYIDPGNPIEDYQNRTFVNDAQGHVLMRSNLAVAGQERQLVVNGEVQGLYGMVPRALTRRPICGPCAR